MKTQLSKTTHLLKKAFKWAGFILSGLLLIVLGLFIYSTVKFDHDRNRTFRFDEVKLEIPKDSASISRGSHWYTVYGCKECHGPDLRGRMFIDDPMLGRIHTANLTRGEGGLPAGFSEKDWLMALKHGINKEGKPLLVMPSDESTRIPDKDLVELIAYCIYAEPVNYVLGENKAGPLAKILYGLGQLPLFTVDKIDHSQLTVEKPEISVSEDFGAVLTLNCTGCHRENFEGGPPLAPGHPPVPNISSAGRPGTWTEEQFMQTLRSGITPDGHALNNDIMPWKRFGEYSDVELKAIRKYILSFPKTTGSKN